MAHIVRYFPLDKLPYITVRDHSRPDASRHVSTVSFAQQDCDLCSFVPRKFLSFRDYLQMEEGVTRTQFAQQKQITSKTEVNLSTRCSFDRRNSALAVTRVNTKSTQRPPADKSDVGYPARKRGQVYFALRNKHFPTILPKNTPLS